MKTKTATTIATLQLLVAFSLIFFTSCAHTYHAPDPTKVKASTAKVKADQKRAHQLNQEVKTALKESHDNADSIIILSNDLNTELDNLIKVAPAEMQPALAKIKSLSTQQQVKEQELTINLDKADTKNTELEKHQTLTDTHVTELETNQGNYFKDSTKLAATATNLSAKLAWYQLHWWGSWIVFGIGLVLSAAWGAFKLYKKFFLV